MAYLDLAKGHQAYSSGMSRCRGARVLVGDTRKSLDNLRFGQLWDCLFKKAEKFLFQEGRKEKKEERERNQNGVDNTCILGCCEN